MTDQEVQPFLADLAIIILPARLLGMAAKRLGQPPVLGEIIPRHSVPADSSGDAHLTVRAAPGAASDDLDQWVQDLGWSRLMGQR